jgi:glyoxylase-like metal-dependent hydrolase (beta-lactamase superfamily II)
MRILTATLLSCFIALSAHATEGIQTLKVKDNVHVLISPQGGNVTVLTGKDGTVLIDDQLTGRSEIIQTAAKKIGGGDIKFILNTHYHYDHTGGNEAFGENEGTIIVAHDSVRNRLNTRQFITYFQKEMLPLKAEGLPSVTFSENMSLHYNDNDIRFIHAPSAHTDGDTIVHLNNDNVIIAGDLLFSGIYPFIDIEHGGSIQGVIKGLADIITLATNETIIIPGHGTPMNKETLKIYNAMLISVSNNVALLINKGKALEEVIADKPTLEFDNEYGGGFISPEAFTTLVYNSLKK